MGTPSSNSLLHALKIALLSTAVLILAVLLAPHLPNFLSSLRSFLRPPYLYVLINCIILTIAASSRLHHHFTTPNPHPNPHLDAFRFYASPQISPVPASGFDFSEVLAYTETTTFRADPEKHKPNYEPELVRSEVKSLNYEPETVKSEVNSRNYEPELVRSEVKSRNYKPETVKSEVNSRNYEPETVRSEVNSWNYEPEKVGLQVNSWNYEPETVRSEVNSRNYEPETVRLEEKRRNYEPDTVNSEDCVEEKPSMNHIAASVEQIRSTEAAESGSRRSLTPTPPVPLARQETFDVVSSFFQTQYQDKAIVTPPLPPLARQETSEMVSSFFQTQLEKPPPSARFGHHRRPTKSTQEGGKALRVAKPKRAETLESTWKTITEGRQLPLTRHLKKSDTFENHHREVNSSPVKKSETFTDLTNFTAVAAAAAKLKKDPSLSQEELNRRVEAFIQKVNTDMKLQRQQSMQQFTEMINRATN